MCVSHFISPPPLLSLLLLLSRLPNFSFPPLFPPFLVAPTIILCMHVDWWCTHLKWCHCYTHVRATRVFPHGRGGQESLLHTYSYQHIFLQVCTLICTVQDNLKLTFISRLNWALLVLALGPCRFQTRGGSVPKFSVPVRFGSVKMFWVWVLLFFEFGSRTDPPLFQTAAGGTLLLSLGGTQAGKIN